MTRRLSEEEAEVLRDQLGHLAEGARSALAMEYAILMIGRGDGLAMMKAATRGDSSTLDDLTHVLSMLLANTSNYVSSVTGERMKLAYVDSKTGKQTSITDALCVESHYPKRG